VLLDEYLLRAIRYEQVDTESADPERVLERIPGWVVRVTV
jgi:hypothetical protein